ncbi:probable protein phosphatase 2C 1 isoform X1 [Tripterygium wilfordii]|uniref:probable protein phosphatase 2C 1 isoform X1 n=1 Tax=Tripterygium wilfordii TaxID=458696 RepID=UPI0018F84BD0|nr:probable protein phosphatase 2C 1 isoform X1 [Tripterygium wilfordii]XP_038712850.1 probable protein phosphatase 2C 1 isoform X1 [Tripterygium wilfordii]XP_038712858.1 probable protein phosphatase 2C 1 isoform X1 [Tripterygium wilfordii]XP_038712867.1 probable protein phosphatase 2C 1 isoform X1 [Tripterygium wilfordii]XP_038712874.1 probable protein phosphatase 2C 1 isoform X1 [Tripterygium wilfordii]
MCPLRELCCVVVFYSCLFLQNFVIWAEQDVDPSLFPRELANITYLVVDEEVKYDPQSLLMKGHAATSSIGSATVRISAMLERNGMLKIANVGDRGLRVIQEGYQYRIDGGRHHSSGRKWAV